MWQCSVRVKITLRKLYLWNDLHLDPFLSENLLDRTDLPCAEVRVNRRETGALQFPEWSSIWDCSFGSILRLEHSPSLRPLHRRTRWRLTLPRLFCPWLWLVKWVGYPWLDRQIVPFRQTLKEQLFWFDDSFLHFYSSRKSSNFDFKFIMMFQQYKLIQYDI